MQENDRDIDGIDAFIPYRLDIRATGTEIAYLPNPNRESPTMGERVRILRIGWMGPTGHPMKRDLPSLLYPSAMIPARETMLLTVPETASWWKWPSTRVQSSPVFRRWNWTSAAMPGRRAVNTFSLEQNSALSKTKPLAIPWSSSTRYRKATWTATVFPSAPTRSR